MYVALRLLFIYADSGYRPETMGGQLDCSTGPECTYMRFLDEGNEEDLVADGITDAASFESAVWRWQGETMLMLTLMTLGGALVRGRLARCTRHRHPSAPRRSPSAIAAAE